MKKRFIKGIFMLLCFSLILPPVFTISAEEITEGPEKKYDISEEVKASDIGLSEVKINNANTEEIETKITTGTLIEIGNTTAEKTTIIIRIKDKDGNDEDQTVEIEKKDTSILNDSQNIADLSNMIAGDQITFTADHYTNSGAIVAKKIRNRSIKRKHNGKNGWIKAIRWDENEIDVTWNNKIFTLNTSEARMVAGLKNPANIKDFKVGDRIRARVEEDGDGNVDTWDAKIIVVLRRGKTLFMRVTRWVVDGTIREMPEDISLPTGIVVKINPSKFYEAGDVNNLIGTPGEILKVDIDEKTRLVRKFMGKAFLKEFSEGDKVRIIGRRNKNTGHLVARFIKNNSIQKLGVHRHFGKVDTVDTINNTIDITLVKTRVTHKNWRLNVLPNTKIFKSGEEIKLSDINVGDIIRVGGVSNRTLKTVDVTKIGVFVRKYLPIKKVN